MTYSASIVSRRQDLDRRHETKLERREQRREERAARRAERAAAGEVGPSIDWDAAVASVVDSPIEGAIRTIARGP